MKRTLLLSLSAMMLSLGAHTPAVAQVEPFIGQLLLVGFNFCPRNFLPTDGRLLSIAQNTALFSLLGCTYGGDCRTTFALPDLRGRVSMSVGQGPGLPPATLGEQQGAPSTTLTVAQMPAHSHQLFGTSTGPSSNSPADALLGTFPSAQNVYATGATPNSPMEANAIGNAGGNQPVSLYQPGLVLTYCIAQVGIFPSRN